MLIMIHYCFNILIMIYIKALISLCRGFVFSHQHDMEYFEPFFSWLLAPAYTIYHRIFTNHWNLSRTFILEFFSVSIKALEYNFLCLNFLSKCSRWLLSYKSGPIMIHGTIDLLKIYSWPGPWYSNFIMSVRIWMIYATNKSGACICMTWCFEINIKH